MSETRVSTYPLPPMQYMNCYTDERVLNGTAPPPPPPLDSNYVMFGVQCTKEDAVIHSLESQGLKRLYPPLYDHKLELKTLNFSILANFLDLIDILIKCPDSADRVQKLEHIKILFINMHHLINEYRPLQARDTLVEMLVHQGSMTRQTADTAAKYLGKVDAIIAKATADLPSAKDIAAAVANAEQMLLEREDSSVGEDDRQDGRGGDPAAADSMDDVELEDSDDDRLDGEEEDGGEVELGRCAGEEGDGDQPMSTGGGVSAVGDAELDSLLLDSPSVDALVGEGQF